MSFAAVILAGGASRRMGSPKALLPYKGQTFLTKLISAFQPVSDRVIVVLGHNSDTIRSEIDLSSVHIAVNPSPERGQLTSLQTGLREVGTARHIFFTPVDYPAIRPSTIAFLAEHALPSGPVVPQYNGRHGHPVLIPASVASEILVLGEDESARKVMHRHAPHTRYIDVDDPGILQDVDDPETYRALVEAAL